MVGTGAILGLAGGLALLLSNGFFVTTEFALTRVRQFPEEEFAEEPSLARAWEMTEQLEIYLSGCQLGITISSVSLGVVAEPAVTALLDAGLRAMGLGTPGTAGHLAVSVLTAVALINLLHVIVAEQAPTYLGIERTKGVCRWGATPLFVWTKVMWPVIWISDRVAKELLRLFGVEITRSWTEEPEEAPATRSELRRQMGDALRGAGLPHERQQEVLRAFEIGDRTVDEVMIPRDEIVALSTEESFETNLERIRQAPHVRFPLVGASLDAYEGIVYAPAVLRALEALEEGSTRLEAIAAEPLEVAPEAVVSDLIDRFQEEHQELALVRDRGTTVGLVTATDAFEAIIGELEDPLDVERAER